MSIQNKSPEKAIEDILVATIRNNNLAAPGSEMGMVFRTIASGLAIRGKGTVLFYFVFQRIATVEPRRGLDEFSLSPAVFQFVAVAREGAEVDVDGESLTGSRLCDALTEMFRVEFESSGYCESCTVERDDTDPDTRIDVRISTILVKQSL